VTQIVEAKKALTAPFSYYNIVLWSC